MAAHAPFRTLLRQRSAFVGVSACLLLAFNLLQPVLSVSTRLLDGQALEPVTWGRVYAFARFEGRGIRTVAALDALVVGGLFMVAPTLAGRLDCISLNIGVAIGRSARRTC